MIIPSVRWREFVAIDLPRRDDYMSPPTRRSGSHPIVAGAINLPFGRGSRVHGRVTHCMPYIRVSKRVRSRHGCGTVPCPAEPELAAHGPEHVALTR
jgi:hypothetical protein